MKTRSILVAAVLVAAPVLPPRPAHAQVGVKIIGGVTVPFGNTADAQVMGWHAGAGVVYTFPTLPQLMLDLTSGIHRLPGSTVEGFAGPALRVIDAQLNGTFRLLTERLGQLRPFITAGGGLFGVKPVGDHAPANAITITDFGLNAGLGIEFRFAGLAMFAEGRYTDVFTEGENLTYIPVSLGVLFGGR
jgi:hypothetical protein